MNKLVGIIGAMDMEVSGLISKMENTKSTVFGGMTFTEGKLCGKNVVISKCGIGKVFAAMCAQTMILKFAPDFIINSGVAGALSESLNIMDAVIATRVVQHDMDTSPLGDPKGLISGINVVYIDTDKSVSASLTNAANELNVNTVRGIIASGDQFVASHDRKKEIEATNNNSTNTQGAETAGTIALFEPVAETAETVGTIACNNSCNSGGGNASASGGFNAIG
jgi:adenosylhomocysteine nucleosidase